MTKSGKRGITIKRFNLAVITAVLTAFMIFNASFAFAGSYASAGDTDGDAADSLESANDITVRHSGTQPISVYLNGEELVFDSEPEIIDGTTFVPMRTIFEALGADIEWNDERHEVVASCGLDEIVLKIGSKVAIHNTDVSMLNAAPYIKEDCTMVPLRYLSEALSCDVKWDSANNRVDITDGDSASQESSTGEGEAKTVLGAAAGITYNDAMQKAIKNSSSCKNANLSLRQAEQRSDEFNNLYTVNYSFTIMQNRKDMQLLTDWSEKNVILTQEQTAYSVTNSMDEISLKLMDIENQKAAIEYAEKTYATNKIKYDIGTIGKKALDSSADEVESAKKQLSSYETELEGLYIALYSAMGQDYSNHSVSEGDPDKTPKVEKFLEPEFSVDYEPLGEDVNMQEAYNAAVANDPYIWYVEHSEENADFKLITYEYNVGEQSYALTDMDLQSAKITTATTRDNLRKTLYSRYNQLLQIEENIDMLSDSMETLRDNIDTMRMMYEEGLQSKAALEEVLQNERTIKYNLLNLKVSHEQLRSIFEKPYLAPEYISS